MDGRQEAGRGTPPHSHASKPRACTSYSKHTKLREKVKKPPHSRPSLNPRRRSSHRPLTQGTEGNRISQDIRLNRTSRVGGEGPGAQPGLPSDRGGPADAQRPPLGWAQYVAWGKEVT